MKLLLECSALILPALIYALWNGRNGLKHPNFEQVKNVACLMILCVTGVRFLALYKGWEPFAINISEVLWWYLKAFLVAITGFGLFFNPLINFVLVYHNYSLWDKLKVIDWIDIKYFFEHLSPTAWPDRWFLKFKIHWAVRLAIYLTLFILSILWFAL
jgi:hypothetical protein